MGKFVAQAVPHPLPYPKGGDDVLQAVLGHIMRTFPDGPPHQTVQDALKDGIEVGVQIGLMMHMMARRK